MRTVIFGVTKKGIEVTASNPGGKKGRKSLGTAKNPDEMKALLARAKLTDRDIVMFSSSMDFPDEYTSNKVVLAMVEKLQSTRR